MREDYIRLQSDEILRKGRKALYHYGRESILYLHVAPSDHLRLTSPCLNASRRIFDSGSSSTKFISTPMRRTCSGCCARAGSDHPAATPPRKVMNSRRLI